MELQFLVVGVFVSVIMFSVTSLMGVSTAAMTVVVTVSVLSTQMVVSITLMKNLHLDEVEAEAHASRDQHDFAIDLLWFDYSHDCSV